MGDGVEANTADSMCGWVLRMEVFAGEEHVLFDEFL
jgi:hypothetical protein